MFAAEFLPLVAGGLMGFALLFAPLLDRPARKSVRRARFIRMEAYRLSRPFPAFRLCRDGRDVVVSIGSRYFRFAF